MQGLSVHQGNVTLIRKTTRPPSPSQARILSAPLWDGYVLVERGVGLKWTSPPGEEVLVYNIYRKEKKEVSFTPSSAIRSRCGVWLIVEPNGPMSP